MGVNGSMEMGMCLEPEQRMAPELGNLILYQGVEGCQFSGTSPALVENEGVGASWVVRIVMLWDCG
jgi:hypothetical protein